MKSSSFLCEFALFCLSTAYSSLSNETLRLLPAPGTDFDIKDGSILAPILQPRVPGTPGSENVRNHIVNFFHSNLPLWNVTLQNSTSKTPTTGNRDVPFVNIVARRDPPWSDSGDVGRLTLVAHYDSLSLEGFVGAVDSAAPVAMLMHAARSIDDALTRKWNQVRDDDSLNGMGDDRGIQILFLDGEEAFKTWTDTDSTYGARSLAEEWDHTYHAALSTYKTELSSISLFVLLDLLGSKNPRIPSYYRTTHWAYKRMASVENRLRLLGLFKSSPNYRKPEFLGADANPEPESRPTKVRPEPFFLDEMDKKDDDFRGWMIQDDHVPFLSRGVEILHIIPMQFPGVWHRVTDDGEHLDMDTVEDWSLLTTAFAAEWMDLEGFFDANQVDEHGFWWRSTGRKTEL